MEIKSLQIKNYKGIEDVTLNFSRCKNANIFTLAGLNESGKTTVLEAIERFAMGEKPEENPVVPQGFGFNNNTNLDDLIPKHRKDNFSDDISFVAKVSLSQEDVNTVIHAFNDCLNEYDENDIRRYTELNSAPLHQVLVLKRVFSYRDSNFLSAKLIVDSIETRSKGQHGFSKCQDDEILSVINSSIQGLMPSINYFPAALSEFPEKIYLKENQSLRDTEQRVNSCYQDIVSDILSALELDLQSHIIDRIGEQGERDSLESVIHKIEALINKHVVTEWENIFPSDDSSTRLERRAKAKILGTKRNPYLEITLRQGEDPYKIGETSLGHRWFFCFLMFTNFRKHRVQGKPVIFLLDEPAASLHPSAQSRMLQAFAGIAEGDCNLIYTTHSPYLIEANWLESTFIVRDKADWGEFDIGRATVDVEVLPYRVAISSGSSSSEDYYRIILDALDYSVPKIDILKNEPRVLLEGIGDHAIFGYFSQVEFDERLPYEFIPGRGAGKSIPVLQILSSYCQNYLVLLDGDKAGVNAKEAIERVFYIGDQRIILLSDIDEKFSTIESLISHDCKKAIGAGSNASEKKALRNHFKEHIARGTKIGEIDDETRENFSRVFAYLNANIIPEAE